MTQSKLSIQWWWNSYSLTYRWDGCCYILAMLEEKLPCGVFNGGWPFFALFLSTPLLAPEKRGRINPKTNSLIQRLFRSFPSCNFPLRTPTPHLLLLLTLCTKYRECPKKSGPQNTWKLEDGLNEMLGLDDILFSITGYVQWISMPVNKHLHSHILAIHFNINIWWIQYKPKSFDISYIKSSFTRNNSLQV